MIKYDLYVLFKKFKKILYFKSNLLSQKFNYQIQTIIYKN